MECQKTLCGVVLLGLISFLMSYVGAQTTAPDSIVVTSVLGRPYLFVKSSAVGAVGNDRYGGFVKDLLDELSDRTQISLQLSVRDDGAFGMRHPNGTWGGLIGELLENRAEMAVGPITETEARARVVNFGTHFQTFGRVAIVKQFITPTTRSISLDVRLGRLFAPLDDSVWLLSGMAWFVSSLVLYLICRINPYEWRRMAKDREATLREGESFNCVNTYWFMIAAIFWQGFMRSPRSMGARIVVTYWWLYALIFVSMYIASLTNYLQSVPQEDRTLHKNYSHILSLQDIVENETIEIGAMKDGATTSFIRNSKISTYEKLWERLAKDNLFETTLEAGIERVRQSTRKKPFVFFAESTMAQYYLSQPPCDLYMIRDFPLTGSYSFAYSLGSKYLIPLNLALYKMKESGQLSQLERKWFNGQCKGNYRELPAEKPAVVQFPPFQRVDLASFSGALILLLIGLAAGSIVTLIEILIYKYAEKDHRERIQEKRLMKDQHSDLPKDNQDPSSNSGQPMTDV